MCFSLYFHCMHVLVLFSILRSSLINLGWWNVLCKYGLIAWRVHTGGLKSSKMCKIFILFYRFSECLKILENLTLLTNCLLNTIHETSSKIKQRKSDWLFWIRYQKKGFVFHTFNFRFRFKKKKSNRKMGPSSKSLFWDLNSMFPSVWRTIRVCIQKTFLCSYAWADILDQFSEENL